MGGMEREGMVSLHDAPGLYHVDRRTLDRWIAAGRLASHKFPRDKRTYVRREELEAVMQAEPAPRGRLGNWRRIEEVQ